MDSKNIVSKIVDSKCMGIFNIMSKNCEHFYDGHGKIVSKCNINKNSCSYSNCPLINFVQYQKPEEHDVEIYKLACAYVAKTELYDRSFTDARCKFDDTEALLSPEIFNICNEYANKLRKAIIKTYNVDWNEVKESISLHGNYKAQKWIDEYERLWKGEFKI